jgi:sec-independent protein translocase protein TatA
MGLSFSHILIVAFVVILLFGPGKISGLLSDLAAGLKSFKRTMNEPDGAVAAPRAISATAESVTGTLAARDREGAPKTS